MYIAINICQRLIVTKKLYWAGTHPQFIHKSYVPCFMEKYGSRIKIGGQTFICILRWSFGRILRNKTLLTFNDWLEGAIIQVYYDENNIRYNLK